MGPYRDGSFNFQVSSFRRKDKKALGNVIAMVIHSRTTRLLCAASASYNLLDTAQIVCH